MPVPVTVGGVGVLGATACLPRVGFWHMDAVIDSADAISGSVQVVLTDSIKLTGFVLTGAPYTDTGYYRIVGGAGGLAGSKVAQPRAYGQCPLSVPLRALLGDVGEQLDGTSDAGAIGTQLRGWTTLGVPSGRQLAALLQAAPAGTAYRFLANGNLWVGPESWPDSGVDYDDLGQLPQEGRVEIGTEDASLLPGTLLGGQKVGYVEHRFTAGVLRTLAIMEPS